jgi:hypothetical protein
MPSYFSPEVEPYFEAWIKSHTWYTGDPPDMENFYRFLKALNWDTHGQNWSLGLKDLIIQAVQDFRPSGDWQQEQLQQTAENFQILADMINNYEQTSYDPPGELPLPLVIE